MSASVLLVALLLSAGVTPLAPTKGAVAPPSMANAAKTTDANPRGAAAVRASVAASTSAAPNAEGDADAAWLLLADHREEELRDRIVEMSGRLIGTPYVHSPLGEGEGVDPDPTIRFDAVDCLTFVEETLALSLAQEPTHVRRLLDQLRYADHRAWEERNHLMEVEWLPNNVKKGFLRDVTREYGGADTVRTKKVLSKDAWTTPSAAALNLPAEKQFVGDLEFDLLPLEKVMKHAKDIPSGTVLVVVREDKPTRITRVTHLGFVIQKGKRTYLRHAARNIFKSVTDEDLENFLLRNSKYAKWKVSGVALYEPVPQSEVQSAPKQARDSN